ncbi:MAG: hypothetical protein WC547_09760 [Candidatus Omnitrophota bacterium]
MKKFAFMNSWVLAGILTAVIVCIILLLYGMRYEPFSFIYAAF